MRIDRTWISRTFHNDFRKISALGPRTYHHSDMPGHLRETGLGVSAYLAGADFIDYADLHMQ